MKINQVLILISLGLLWLLMLVRFQVFSETLGETNLIISLAGESIEKTDPFGR